LSSSFGVDCSVCRGASENFWLNSVGQLHLRWQEGLSAAAAIAAQYQRLPITASVAGTNGPIAGVSAT
jgi:hypothetical protein